jgi:hypothetical protein
MKTARAKRHMPKAMVHACSVGVLLMIQKSSQRNKQSRNTKLQMNSIKASFKQPYPTQNDNTKSQAKQKHGNRHPAQLNELTVEIKNLQMTKTDQR